MLEIWWFIVATYMLPQDMWFIVSSIFTYKLTLVLEFGPMPDLCPLSLMPFGYL